ncbi:pyridoxamine 5'-phosphate oxidase family protein [Bacillus sp. MRMR6]|uniref:pyridoxamine 5'-phosphate oxidase family protein n=1 Tax=Bacillus sp. MRMR6 TaxID=1928617 RepID=UPI0009534769|nr:pyridoxamine 5'-phosphate oxidase family protein [Bacillus sp. MRMR6]OLS36906.1 phosphohydrolase [Bacillus sp. MRMR6]
MRIFNEVVGSKEELRSFHGKPSMVAKNKVITNIDEHIREFLALSPFLVVSTSDKEGKCDVSPRGDHPGFVMVLNEKQILIPERPGNNRLDSLTNILENPQVGLLFFIPGLRETLRINGKACLVRDEDQLEQMAVNGKRPLVAIAVDVEECFVHCAKALIRSELWNPESWTEQEYLLMPSKMLAVHAKIDSETVEARLKESYEKKLY